MDAEKSSYFNTSEYFSYLKKNFPISDESYGRDETCNRPNASVLDDYLAVMMLSSGNAVLEIGSGLGRLLRVIMKRYSITPYGIDVSKEAVKQSIKDLPELEKNIKHGFAEKIPFDHLFFDAIVCWGVFDLTEQHLALSEMIRVLKVGGILLLTGKNDQYCENDEDAKIAEIKSRELGLPNHYTNFNELKNLIQGIGCSIELSHFFIKRGDMAAKKYVTEEPEKFLEYCLLIKKVSNTFSEIRPIASKYSKILKVSK
ncbi:bifunctional 2-polyprenyl-6-hydroxyphenol methylase/3-demethylubiquinol 3-O-methyltransferase UbiG [Polynucleobacter sp. JS-JIR-5-A7]|uniref:class I SAM-dependent methyltransferase n=1 Tax=Polynucleobacter sp. JS-JIR-5-A7 TaxID=1758395 RepID=UPI001BFD5762|nr:class I SAM-dependent methyltransferase [Polynucleobacter sp. JS-JIR-5-A7]QWE06943.1 class I SAM-dependent methyltransferase [Polynucleobacter sp. JS-JIR-5-A7]